MKKILGMILGGFALVTSICGQAMATGTAYFELPVGFADNVTATVVGIAGSVMVILGLMFAYRKAVKSVNRS